MMARLPGDRYLIQQIDGVVVLFQDHSEQELVRFDPSNADAVAKAQGVIAHLAELTEEERCFAHFWSGYFWAHAGGYGE